MPSSTSRNLLSSNSRPVSNARISCAGTVLTCTGRNHPMRISCAMLRASLRSVFTVIAFSAALLDVSRVDQDRRKPDRHQFGMQPLRQRTRFGKSFASLMMMVSCAFGLKLWAGKRANVARSGSLARMIRPKSTRAAIGYAAIRITPSIPSTSTGHSLSRSTKWRCHRRSIITHREVRPVAIWILGECITRGAGERHRADPDS